jgi:transposase
MPPQPYGKIRGRPSKITDVVAVAKDGREITTSDRIVDAIRSGAYPERAAQAAGVPYKTFYDWLQRGARVNADLIAGKRTEATCSAFELAAAELSERVAQADAEAEEEHVLLARKLAVGGIEQVSTKNRRLVKPDGRVETEDITTKSHTLPDAAMLRWRMAHRWPERWQGERLELSGPGGGPIELSIDEKRAKLLQALEVRAERLAAPLELEPDEEEPPDVE